WPLKSLRLTEFPSWLTSVKSGAVSPTDRRGMSAPPDVGSFSGHGVGALRRRARVEPTPSTTLFGVRARSQCARFRHSPNRAEAARTASLDPGDRVADDDLIAGGGDPTDRPGPGCLVPRLHLHRRDHRHLIAGLALGAVVDEVVDEAAGHRRGHRPSIFAAACALSSFPARRGGR